MLNTEDVVKNVLADTLNFSEPHKIQLGHCLADDFQLDSMGSLMFLIKLEESIDGFFVDPETFELRDIETVGSIVRYIDMQLLSKERNLH